MDSVPPLVYTFGFTGRKQPPSSIGFDRAIGRGNTVDNARERYPNAIIVEYHLSASDPAMAAMDWRSLRLVFGKRDGRWWLQGVVHAEWTS